MPYIKPKRRKAIAPIANMLLDEVQEDGELNFALFYMFKLDWVNDGPSYWKARDFIGELNECIAEIRRRYLAPYEDKKIEENGDV